MRACVCVCVCVCVFLGKEIKIFMLFGKFVITNPFSYVGVICTFSCVGAPSCFLPPFSQREQPDRVAQSIARPTHEQEVPGSIPGPATYFRFFFR